MTADGGRAGGPPRGDAPDEARGDADARSDAGEAFDFAAALEELETIVARLDRDEVDLDEAIALFRRGIGRVAEAQRWLDEASGRIEELISGRSGRLETRPLDVPAPRDGGDIDAPDRSDMSTSGDETAD